MRDTKMSDADLDKKLASYIAPAPSDLLKARILKAAQQERHAEKIDAPARPFIRRFAPIAATIMAVCAIGFATLQINDPAEQPTEAEAWQEAALNLGFDDLYAWVEEDIE